MHNFLIIFIATIFKFEVRYNNQVAKLFHSLCKHKIFTLSFLMPSIRRIYDNFLPNKYRVNIWAICKLT